MSQPLVEFWNIYNYLQRYYNTHPSYNYMCIRADNLHIFQPKQQAEEADTDPAASSKQDMDHWQKY